MNVTKSRFKLYATTSGLPLVYTFPAVQFTNAPKIINKKTVIEGIRGQGCIIIPGSDSSWDLEIRGVLMADNYEDLVDLIDALESAVVMFIEYVLEIEKDSSTEYSYNVKRIEPIEYPESLRNNYQEYSIKLKANSW